MRVIHGLVVGVFVLAALLSSAEPAAALRPSCSELLDLRNGGWSDDEIVQTYGTTRARLAACERLAEQSQRFAAQRAQFFQQRDDRGLSH
jgi:hypothetical protein